MRAVAGRLSFACVALWAARVDAAEPLSLERALVRVADLAPEARVARAGIPIAEAELSTARMFPNPTVALTAARAEPSFTAALQLRLPIFGQKSALRRAAERGLEAAAAEVENLILRLRRDTRIAYYTAARAEQELAIAQDIEALTRRVADMANQRFEAGAGTRLEREQASLVHVRAEQDVSDRAAVTGIAAFELARLLGIDPAELGALSDPLPKVGNTPALAALIEDAVQRHPEIVLLQRQRNAALARADLARAERIPTPTVEIGFEVLNPSTCGPDATSHCLGPRAGLAFDVPILNQNSGPIARAEAEASQLELRRAATEYRVRAAVQSAYRSLDAARVRARFFDERYVPSADTVEQMAREGFSAGRTGLLPLLEAERAVLEARNGRSAALFAVQAARADLEELSGVPLSAP